MPRYAPRRLENMSTKARPSPIWPEVPCSDTRSLYARFPSTKRCMKILIATGIYPPDIGGPAQYAQNTETEFKKMGHEVRLLTFRFERKLPTGVRHLWFFFRVLFSLRGVDMVFVLDTFSAALPAALAARLLRKKVLLRTGGGFFLGDYFARTGGMGLF